jgi:hypothetical protein
MNRDYIPGTDHDFLAWSGSFLDSLASLAAQINFPDTKVGEMITQRRDFAYKLTITDNATTRTKVTIKEKNDAHATLEATIRESVQEYLTSNHLVTDVIRDRLGIPIHSKERHPSPVAPHAPYIFAFAGDLRQVRFDFGESKDSMKKPAGQHGVEVASVIADTKPSDTDELTRSSFDTHTPLVLTFKEPERGKTLWYAARWENTRGEKGIWSEIMSVVIP